MNFFLNKVAYYKINRNVAFRIILKQANAAWSTWKIPYHLCLTLIKHSFLRKHIYIYKEKNIFNANFTNKVFQASATLLIWNIYSFKIKSMSVSVASSPLNNLTRWFGWQPINFLGLISYLCFFLPDLAETSQHFLT